MCHRIWWHFRKFVNNARVTSFEGTLSYCRCHSNQLLGSVFECRLGTQVQLAAYFRGLSEMACSAAVEYSRHLEISRKLALMRGLTMAPAGIS